ncbi:MAG: response regulator transcription factor, partial [Chloroflexi bacterium]|nr:response regulator transcription factor [Chloroflexota bacterium]
LVAEIRTKSPESKILVCSAVTINGIVRYLLHLGISGYVFENMDPRALLVAIRTVASGGSVFSEAILRG